MNRWISNDSVNQWGIEPTNRWNADSLANRPFSESTNQWINGWVNELVDESMNQRTNESLIQRANESMNQWIHEPMNHLTNASMNQWTKGWRRDGWMDGWASYFSLLSYFFTERPLCWDTSSLSCFSHYPLIWATSALSCLPASFFVASAMQIFSSCSCYNSSLQLQSRIAQE